MHPEGEEQGSALRERGCRVSQPILPEPHALTQHVSLSSAIQELKKLWVACAPAVWCGENRVLGARQDSSNQFEHFAPVKNRWFSSVGDCDSTTSITTLATWHESLMKPDRLAKFHHSPAQHL